MRGYGGELDELAAVYRRVEPLPDQLRAPLRQLEATPRGAPLAAGGHARVLQGYRDALHGMLDCATLLAQDLQAHGAALRAAHEEYLAAERDATDRLR